MIPEQVAKIISLVWTVPTIAFGGAVLYLWGGKAWKILRANPFLDGLSSTQWFIVGVTIGFIGQILDNGYWAIPWTLDYVKSEHAGKWFHSGVFFNIPFRQVCGTVAAYCHVRSAVEFSKENKEEAKLDLAQLVFSTIFLSVFITITLLFLYPGAG